MSLLGMGESLRALALGRARSAAPAWLPSASSTSSALRTAHLPPLRQAIRCWTSPPWCRRRCSPSTTSSRATSCWPARRTAATTTSCRSTTCARLLLRCGAAAPADEWLGCAQDLIKNFEVEYIAGGATMNSIRVAQWMSQKAGATAYFGCIGKDDSGEQLKAACSAAGVNGQFLEDAVRPSGPPCLARGRLSPRSPWPEHGAARRRRRRASARRW